MLKYTIEVNGMMCGMCEAHTNDAVRKAFPDVKKVNSSHTKNQTVVVSENELDEELLRKTISDTGYDVGKIEKEVYKKKLFGF